MYKKAIWRFPGSIEYEYKYKGRYGAKGEKRAGRIKPTPEQIRRQNQRNREIRVRRLLKANFTENDYWLTLKYPAGTKLDMDEVKKHMKKFLDKTRRDYKKKGQAFQFIYCIEIGKRGSPHVHIVVNRIEGADLIINKNWEQGRVNFELTYEAGGFKNLAEYIVKQPDEEECPRRGKEKIPFIPKPYKTSAGRKNLFPTYRRKNHPGRPRTDKRLLHRAGLRRVRRQ